MKKLYCLLLLCLSFTHYSNAQCNASEIFVEIQVNTDFYGYETAWSLVGNDSTLYGEVGFDFYGNLLSYDTSFCVPSTECIHFTVFDQFADGIAATSNYGVILTVDGVVYPIITGDFDYYTSYSFGCVEGEVCNTADSIALGTYTTTFDDHWYIYTTDSSGLYRITTCGLNTCDTKIWVYDDCDNLEAGENVEGTLFYDDNGGNCGLQAVASSYLEGGETILIRIGDNADLCTEGVTWSLLYEGPLEGCMDPTSCNFNPLAGIDDGSCLPQSHPDCPDGPDLLMDEAALISSLEVDTYTSVNGSSDDCLIQEQCLLGYGEREIIRFTTRIENIGETDYYVGSAQAGATQISWDNCHNHFHYDSYAEYLLYDENANKIPIGFKNGFCVIDLICPAGIAPQYSCGNMGITAGCTDLYDASLECQWIDVTDIADGTYTFVSRVNWRNAPDLLGRIENDTINNWAQACITIDRSSGSLDMVVETDCPSFTDCAGIPFGDNLIDCTGECGGTSLMGDVDGNGNQQIADAQEYVELILSDDILATTCNDLNADGDIDVYDAALISSCFNYGATHNHMGQGSHDHCVFPAGIVNIFDTTALSIIGYDLTAQFIDIGIFNKTADVVAYQFDITGINMTSVENLVDPAEYPINPAVNLSDGKIIGLSYVDSLISRNTNVQPLCRVYFSEVDGDMICINSIQGIINQEYEETITRIDGDCVFIDPIIVNNLIKPIRVKVEPNPFNYETKLSFSNHKNETFRLEIMDMNGRVMQRIEDIRGNEVLVKKGNLSSGIYIYKLVGEEHIGVGRMVME